MLLLLERFIIRMAMSYYGYADYESYCNREVARLGIMPPKLEDYKCEDDMIVKNYTHTDENGNHIACRIITYECFNLMIDYLYTKHPHFKVIKKQMDIEEKAREEKDDSDKKAQQRAEAAERKEKEKERERLQKIKNDELYAKYGRDQKKRIEKEIREDYKEYFDTEPTAEIRYCELCKDEDDVCKYYRNAKIYPKDFIDPATDKPCTTKLYEKSKYIRDITCCVECYDDRERVELERQQSIKKEYCDVCDKKYILRTIITNDDHLISDRHKENYKIWKFKIDNHKKYKYRLEWLNIHQLHQICSDSKDNKGFNIIPNYSNSKKYKRYDLIMKMYEVYDQLTINDSIFAS